MTENLPALPDDLDSGLEDFDPNQASLPRISLVHGSGVFKDNQTNTEFGTMYGVILGLIKQRTMFAGEIPPEGTLKPQCKSNDAIIGYPTVEGKRDELFPWGESGIDPKSVPTDEYGRPTLPCEACPFSKWGPNRKPPRCAERHTFPILYNTEPGEPPQFAGIVSFQKSGITPSKNFLSGFVRTKMPVYSATVELSLERHKRGSVEYSTPVFKRTGDTDQNEWEGYSEQYKGIREFLRRPPRADEENQDPAKQQTAGGSPTASDIASQFDDSSSPTALNPWANTGPIGGTSVVDAVATPVVLPDPLATAEPDNDLPF